MLTIQDLTYLINRRCLFKHLNFEVQRGEIMQIVGNNGCGKTTLLRILIGLIQPYCGQIYWNHLPIQQSEYLENILYLGHALGMHPLLTCQEQLNEWISIYKIDHPVAQLALDKFKLPARTRIIELSLGQQRRLALIKFFLVPLPLWFLDEPIQSLDVQGQNLFHELIQNHSQRGGVIICTSHQKINFVSKKIILMQHD